MEIKDLKKLTCTPYTTNSFGKSGELYKQNLYYNIETEGIISKIHLVYTLSKESSKIKDKFNKGDNKVVLKINGKELETKYVNIDFTQNKDTILYETIYEVESKYTKVLYIECEYSLGIFTEQLSGGYMNSTIVVPRIIQNTPKVELFGSLIDNLLVVSITSNVPIEYSQLKINDNDWIKVEDKQTKIRLSPGENYILGRARLSSGEILESNRLYYKI